MAQAARAWLGFAGSGEARRYGRQLDDETRASGQHFLEPDIAIVPLDDRFRDRQTDAGADADRLGGEIRFEDTVADRFGNAGPVVLDRKAGIAAIAGECPDLDQPAAGN